MRHFLNIIIIIAFFYIASHVDGWTVALVILTVVYMAIQIDEIYKRIKEEFDKRLKGLGDEEEVDDLDD